MTFAFLINSVPFTHAVIAGDSSLGGSESACLGLARALSQRGHEIHLFVHQLDEACIDHIDAAGCHWNSMDAFWTTNQFFEFDVCIALRMHQAFQYYPIQARLRILWSQDLLVPGRMQNEVMAVAWGLDHIAYVSEYHRKQWEQMQPELAPLGWVTRNGFDPADVPTDPRPRDPYRIIYSSRPERGLGPLLTMWPALKTLEPRATLQICRYSSMYDKGPGSWSDVCDAWDRNVKQCNEQIGGVEYLGELNKKQLYDAISGAAVMWYPGIANFAETNCISALEAAACGTAFVGSYRGALPETSPTGILIRGDAQQDDAYHRQSVTAVRELLEECAQQTFAYRKRQQEGVTLAQRWSYDRLAQDWEVQIEAWFAERYATHKPQILRQLLHEDDHVAAKILAQDIYDTNQAARSALARQQAPYYNGALINLVGHTDPNKGEVGLCAESFRCVTCEAIRARDFCDRVIAGKDQTAEHYGFHAQSDPIAEAKGSSRFQQAATQYATCTHVLDVACGNGAFAIYLAQQYPALRVTGLDYSQQNVEVARTFADQVGVGDRCTFLQMPVYDYDTQDLDPAFVTWAQGQTFDGAFIGEFVEHVANCQALIDGIDAACQPGAVVIYTCPHGPCMDIFPRDVPIRKGHVHHFQQDDVRAVWGGKKHFSVDYFDGGLTHRGLSIGNWTIRYEVDHAILAGPRPLAARIRRTRPMPWVTVGILAKNSAAHLHRCLDSVFHVADEILIGDTGSKDETKQIAATYTTNPKIRVIDLPAIDQIQDGFAGARNVLLALATGEWFLWIDTDEELQTPHFLRRYLDGAIFNGFVLRQTHLYLDGAPTYDVPVRLFRKTPDVQFYGCVHEQPQAGGPNGDIIPCLDMVECRIAHYGYLTADGRERKRVQRNLPLLRKDMQRFPDRELGQVLVCREAIIQADAERRMVGGQMTTRAIEGYKHAMRIFITRFDDPAHKYHKLARPWYEAALRELGIGWEHEFALAGHQGPMNDIHAAPKRIWVRDGEELKRLLAYEANEVAKGMALAYPRYITDPDALLPKEEALHVVAS